MIGRCSSTPQRNAFVERFNGRFRDEGLNEPRPGSLPAARLILEGWRSDDDPETMSRAGSADQLRN